MLCNLFRLLISESLSERLKRELVILFIRLIKKSCSKDGMKNVFVVIPAFNEEKSVGGVLDGLRKSGYENVVVVDDGSKDRTVDVALEHGAVVLSHAVNRGQGAALRTGTEFALEQGADVVVHFDADGQMRAEDISVLVDQLSKEKADVVFGSRFLDKKSNIPITRMIFLSLGRVFMRGLYGVVMSDPQSGFRALSASAAREICITQRGMAHCSEIIEEVHRKGLRFVEVPVVIRYTNYSLQHGQSNLNAFRIAGRLLWKKLVR